MERIRNALDVISRAFAQLSRREKILVGTAGGTAVLFVGSIIFATLRSSATRHELSIAEKEGQLKQVAVYATSFGESERRRREMEARLGGTPLRLMTHMQELCDKHGLVIGSMNDRGESTTDKVKESVVELQIASAPIEKLTPLLNDLEHNARIVKVKKMRLRRLTGDEKAVNVTLTVATYSMSEKG